MFEATLAASDPDRQRLNRLILASLIAVGSTSAALATVWTLDRLGIDRVGAPSAPAFDIAQIHLMPPPEIAEPPPPPPETTSPVAAASEGGEALEELQQEHDAQPSFTSSTSIPDPGASRARGEGPGIPGPPCPGGSCGPIGRGNFESGTCTHPPCGPGGDGVARAKRDPSPVPVEFSALDCRACPDPDKDALRRTAAHLRKRGGRVVVRFCVDTRGRVEPSSIDLERSFGDASVNEIVRAAVTRWRFAPMKVGGSVRRACSRAPFDIKFE